MRNITLNPGGIIGAIVLGGLGVVIITYFTGDASPRKLFLAGVIGGAFAGNFVWERLFQQEPQEEGIDYLQSDITHLKDMLASGSRMRKQTPAEREASQSTFGYERFPLTEKEREEIAREIERLEELLRRAKDSKLK